MKATSSHRAHPWIFILLVFILSIPFYLIGNGHLPIPVNLPVSALGFVCPVIAASILVFWSEGAPGLQRLFARVFDFRRIDRKVWLLPALFLIPLVYFLAYVIMRLLGMPLPNPQTPLFLVPVFFIVYFIAAPFEELGWTGYALEPLQARWGAFGAALQLGVIWAAWHIIPLIQAHNAPDWIFWHGIETVAVRVLMVWIYNNTGRSVFATLLVHASVNVSWSMFPNFGSGYNPLVTGLLMCLAALIVVLAWGPSKLAPSTTPADRRSPIT
jgi:membrane protease YdiL (CAAX protease family)